MAAPVISGAVVLLRQYFMDGYYNPTNVGPSLRDNNNNKFMPSGPLLKAVLLNGALDMNGYSEAGTPLEGTPSSRQGWGLGSLAHAVPLETNTTQQASFALFVVDNATINTNEQHRFCVSLESSTALRPLRVTLAWYDPPASPAAQQTLINDLDLDVQVPQGALAASWGAAVRPDRLNNVERATVEWVVAGQYVVTVSGYNVPKVPPDADGLPYALALTGPRGMVVWQCDEGGV